MVLSLTLLGLGLAPLSFGQLAGSAIAVEAVESRGHTPSIPSLKAVPANGATTIDVSVTL